MVLFRALAAMSAAAICMATAWGCGSGLSKDDADLRCDQEKAALAFSDEVYAQCESCFMDCGDECVRNATSPISYTCGDSSTSTDTSTP